MRVKIPEDHQFQKDWNQPVWHRQLCHSQLHWNHICLHEIMPCTAATWLADEIIALISRSAGLPNKVLSKCVCVWGCVCVCLSEAEMSITTPPHTHLSSLSCLLSVHRSPSHTNTHIIISLWGYSILSPLFHLFILSLIHHTLTMTFISFYASSV